MCTRASQHVGACILLFLICNERWALIGFGDICGSICHYICGYTLTIPPLRPYPPLLQSDQISLVSSFSVEGHWGGTPFLDHNGRAAAKLTIGARWRRFWLSSCSPLPAPSAAKTSSGLAPTQHSCLQPLFTPTSLCTPTPPHPHLPTHHLLQIYWP